MPDDMLRFRRVTGEQEVVSAEVGEDELPAGELLRARTVRLKDGTPGGRELRQHRPLDGERRRDGYTRLDNEILAGRRLHKVAEWSGYPNELARLYGDEASSAEPFTLFGPYEGEPLSAGSSLFDEEVEAFITGLLKGLCWLAGAGIAHRAINPDTVYWDGESVLITDFSRSAPFGTARTPITGLPWGWVPLESRPGQSIGGVVGPTDDVWAAARLIYFVRSRGEDLDDLGKLTEAGLSQMFNGLLERVFGPPDARPTATDLLQRGLRRSSILPALPDTAKEIVEGREAFLRARDRKHPGAAVPAGFWNDLAWTIKQEPSGSAGGS
jgi:serine/threonine protein kinase